MDKTYTIEKENNGISFVIYDSEHGVVCSIESYVKDDNDCEKKDYGRSISISINELKRLTEDLYNFSKTLEWLLVIILTLIL